MGQVTIYLDEESERMVKQASAAEGVPVSRWIARLIQQQAAQQWPLAVRELRGTWQVDEDLERPAEQVPDISRESL